MLVLSVFLTWILSHCSDGSMQSDPSSGCPPGAAIGRTRDQVLYQLGSHSELVAANPLNELTPLMAFHRSMRKTRIMA